MTTQRIWLITGVSSGFGRELTQQLLDRGDRVVGTVRKLDTVADLVSAYPDTFRVERLDVRDTTAMRGVVERTASEFGRVDVMVNNAGYGLFGAAEELSDEQVVAIIATNLTAPIHMTRAVLPHMRAAGGGRIIQMSTYGGQVAFPGNSLYHASKWGLEGFSESLAQEVAPFGIGVTIVEPGGARTEFRYASAQVAEPSRNTRAHLRARSSGCLTPPTDLPPATLPAWPKPSSTALTSSQRHCGSCSAHKPSTAPSQPCRSASLTSRRRKSSLVRPTSRPASDENSLSGAPGERRHPGRRLQLLIAGAAFRCEVSFSCAVRNAAMSVRDIAEPTLSRPR